MSFTAEMNLLREETVTPLFDDEETETVCDGRSADIVQNPPLVGSAGSSASPKT
jgi:hypothetical protein